MIRISTLDLLAVHGRATIINAGKHAGAREVSGAIRYRHSDLMEVRYLALPISREDPVILYDKAGCNRDLEFIAKKFEAEGFLDVRLYDGMISDYETSGGAMQQASFEQIVPPSQPDEAGQLDRRL